MIDGKDLLDYMTGKKKVEKDTLSHRHRKVAKKGTARESNLTKLIRNAGSISKEI